MRHNEVPQRSDLLALDIFTVAMQFVVFVCDRPLLITGGRNPLVSAFFSQVTQQIMQRANRDKSLRHKHF
ncbi:MAG: hypothetical protein AAFQ95_25915, partial [Cyanobacteria bacterium J06621_3]